MVIPVNILKIFPAPNLPVRPPAPSPYRTILLDPQVLSLHLGLIPGLEIGSSITFLLIPHICVNI